MGTPVVLKAQLPVGGRGKAGAVRFAESPEQAGREFDTVTAIIIEGLRAETVLVEPRKACDAEFYLAVALDPDLAGSVLLFSSRGGIAVKEAGAVERISLRQDGTVPASAFRRVAYAHSIRPAVVEQLLGLAAVLARAHSTLEVESVELNPVGATNDGLWPLDARIIVDDRALWRQPRLAEALHASRPRRDEDLLRERSRLEYVPLQGSIGLLGSGAGLTMAAMDLIQQMGAGSSGFLDCSANPTRSGIGVALDMLESNDSVRVILVNICGGLMQVDRLARTIAEIVSTRQQRKPVVMRLMGTGLDEAERILGAAGLTNHRVLEDGVAAAIAAAKTPK